MTKRVTARIYDVDFPGFLDFDDAFIASASQRKAVCIDTFSGQHIVFEGSNLTYEDGRLERGTLQKLTFTDTEGNPVLSFSHLGIDVRLLPGDRMPELAGNILASMLWRDIRGFGTGGSDPLASGNGDDRLFGRGGADLMSGGGGRDVLTGGADDDTFVFTEGMGRDVITDFDADGTDGVQDFIDGDFPGAGAISKSGTSTIVDFGDGDKFVLRNVEPDEIDATDFV